MVVPVPSVALAPPAMVNTEEVASVRLPFFTVNAVPLPRTALVPPVMVRSEDVRLPLVMVRFSPLPITALVPPEMVISDDETLPKIRAFCLELKVFQSIDVKYPFVVEFAAVIDPVSRFPAIERLSGAVPLAPVIRLLYAKFQLEMLELEIPLEG